jgi:hypothetical protein
MRALFDAHAHVTRLAPLDEVAALMRAAGIAGAAVMARETREERILEFARLYPGLVRPMIGGRLFQRALQDGAHKSSPGGVRHYRGFRDDWWRRREDGVFRALDAALATGRFRGVGEIRLKHRGCGSGVPEMKCDYDFEPDHRVILRLLEACARRRVPVVLHLEVDEDRSARLAAFSRALDASPRARAVWAHAGPCEAATLRRMLERHPNLRAEIQPLVRNTYAARVPMLRTFPALARADGSLRAEWRELFEAHADRLMFGSDCRTPSEYRHLRVRADDMRGLLAQVSARAARAIARGTAERLYGG